MSIVGFDDMQIASFVNPTLTTIRQPAYDMGKTGAEVLLHNIAEKSCKPIHRILETSLIIRESTTIAPARKQNTSVQKLIKPAEPHRIKNENQSHLKD